MRPVVLGETDVDVGLAKDGDRRADVPTQLHMSVSLFLWSRTPVGAVGMFLDVPLGD